jgi:dihydroorotate dehydrogenase (fumarate)
MGSFVPWITDWLKSNGYASLQQVRGVLSQARCPDPAAFERANYTKAISSFAGG